MSQSTAHGVGMDEEWEREASGGLEGERIPVTV
jgi:hypothetical protein